MTNICGNFHSNPFTKYTDSGSNTIGVNGEWTMDVRKNGKSDA